MSILHVPHYSHHDLHGSIRVSLEKALHAVVAALTAVTPAAKRSEAPAAARKQKDIRALLSLASRHEDVSPSLAAELRFIARQ
ncbi:hypothetical protein [Janthinobacterium sp. 17J80-10]|uniref:hypothetical protein n=1 Tax=Janthinobacterium sp. 17J80-10 TaxID=2497863 RepID=UPI00100561EA|nr:hypothetical protein [Janthinobacterium sp. 17J80-10]QAU33716.1 hypothetical protein EKL02_05685 [Janthinobacterium sp. 17J80-10]